jgi:hypothetical protein
MDTNQELNGKRTMEQEIAYVAVESWKRLGSPDFCDVIILRYEDIENDIVKGTRVEVTEYCDGTALIEHAQEYLQTGVTWNDVHDFDMEE